MYLTNLTTVLIGTACCIVAVSALPNSAKTTIDIAKPSNIVNTTLTGHFAGDPSIKCAPQSGIPRSDFQCADAFNAFILKLGSHSTVYNIAKVPTARTNNLIVPKLTQAGSCRFKITTSLPVPAIRASVYQLLQFGDKLWKACVNDEHSFGGTLRQEYKSAMSLVPSNFLELQFYVSDKPLTEQDGTGDDGTGFATS